MRRMPLFGLALASFAVFHLGWNCAGASGDSGDAENLALLGALGNGDTSRADDFSIPRSLEDIQRSLDASPVFAEMLRNEAREADPMEFSRDDTTEALLAPGDEPAPVNSLAEIQSEAAARSSLESPDLALARAGRSSDGTTGSTASVPYNGSNGYHYVLLKRVTYCGQLGSFLGISYCKNWTTPSEFAPWFQENVDRGKRKDTYIAHLAQAPKGNTEFLVFGGAGQQPPGNGVDNALTGQAKGYKSGFASTTGARWVTLDRNAMILRANDASRPGTFERLFHPDRTFSAVAYDTKLNFQVGKAEKGKIERAFFKWLTSKAYPANVKLIYLSGSSRGGCLALRLAKLFRQNTAWRNVPLILHSVDGTCAWETSPLDDYVKQSYLTLVNPVMSIPFGEVRYAYYLNPETIFAHRNRMCIRHIVGGGHVVLPVVRQWAWKSGDHLTGWYQQKWMPYQHKVLGRKYEVSEHTIDPFLTHLQRSYKSLLYQTGVCTEPIISIGSGPVDVAGPITGGGGSGGTGTATGTGVSVSPAGTDASGSTGGSGTSGAAEATRGR